MSKHSGPLKPETRKEPSWREVEGTPSPLGVTWVGKDQAVNFAVYSEHAVSVALLLFTSADLTNPFSTFRLDFLRNKSGRIWHCRIPISVIGEARYYAYSVSGPNPTQ